MIAPNFWDDQRAAQQKMQELNALQEQIGVWDGLQERTQDALDLAGMADEDAGMLTELQQEAAALEDELEEREFTLALNGKYDSGGAIISIHAGAGGTEAQDWARMLQRMYLRWAERRRFKSEISDMQSGEEAGIKSASMILKGENAFGLMRSEIGVHRLVRISPFDSNARRHTSFASVFVYPEIDDEIEIAIRPDDLRIDTYRASGAGGQHVNMTDSAVRITHLPTHIVVQCQNERSQHKNKATAMKMLRARLYDLELRKKRSETDKIEASKMGIDFGSQIRNYVLAPYRLVKDLRSQLEFGDVDRVLDGDLDRFMHAFLVYDKTGRTISDTRAVTAN
jgi:peptide chain release factor 2